MPSPTQVWGAQRERLAEAALERAGYRIVARNWRGGGGEIDRVAWDNEVLCFVEVRARRSEGFMHPSLSVDRRKRRKLVRAAKAYLMRFCPGTMPMVRFDVVAIVDQERGARRIEVITNAFRPDD